MHALQDDQQIAIPGDGAPPLRAILGMPTCAASSHVLPLHPAPSLSSQSDFGTSFEGPSKESLTELSLKIKRAEAPMTNGMFPRHDLST